MKRFVLIVAMMAISAGASAGYDIGFSTDAGGTWAYDGTAQTFSFNQPVGVGLVLDGTSDALISTNIFIPSLQVSAAAEPIPGYLTATVTPLSPSEVVIKDGNGNIVLKGDLDAGQLAAYGTTAGLYSLIQVDITITDLTNAVDSDFVNTLKMGEVFDFSLSLQGDVMIPDMIKNGDSVSGNTFSGGMSVIPEPATLALLGLGGLLLRKRK